MAHLSSVFCFAPGCRWLLAPLLLLAAPLVRAQAPGWGGAAPGNATPTGGNAVTRGMAVDDKGNVFVTGAFTGTMIFGSTVLTSAGGTDVFVAKYVPGTNTWAWAQCGGGTSNDDGQAIAVSGSSVYVTGFMYNDKANANAVFWGGTGPATNTSPVAGASINSSYPDLVLVKYQDNGTSATFRWSQVGGGTSGDQGQGVAVSGTSVYVTGQFTNSRTNANAVVFGGGGTTAGTTQVNSASTGASTDLVLAKYTDQGSTATLGWTQVGGGIGFDAGSGVAASGSSVYVTGQFTNSSTNTLAVVFGGNGTSAGTTTVSGAAASLSQDLLLAKYVDNGSSATLAWTQVGGGSGSDTGAGVAVSGASVYVTGSITNSLANTSDVVFGGSGPTAGTTQVNGASAVNSSDLVLAKYTDNGPTATLSWTQVGGGTKAEGGSGVAVSGTSVYVTGAINNDQANTNAVIFGGGGTTAGTAPVPGTSTSGFSDLVLAKYTDQGSIGTYAWAQVGGAGGNDAGSSVAVSGQQVYAAGYVMPGAIFGATTLLGAAGSYLAVLAYLTDATLTPLAAHPITSTSAGFTLCPNPTHSAATLTGATPGAPAQVLDALGRLVLTATADAMGTAMLAGLPAGLYLVQTSVGTARLSVE